MKPLHLAFGLIGIVVGGASAAAVVAPTAPLPGHPEVREALAKRCDGRPREIRRVRCQGYDEEPTEFTCDFERRRSDGRWVRSSLTMAIDGRHGWIDIGRSDCNDTHMSVSE